MDALEDLLAVQHARERQFRGFLYSLDKGRTATLRDILEDTHAVKILQTPWLDVPLFRKRFSALAEFFARTEHHEHVRGYKQLPLVFFQATDSKVDAEAFTQRIGDPWYSLSRRYWNAPPEVFYLHTETNWGAVLLGAWRSRSRVILPLGSFTSYGQFRRDYHGKSWKDKPNIQGTLLPHYSRLLAVSSTVATNYFARMVAHDLGRGFLPPIGPDQESVHNVLMIHAIHPEQMNYHNNWEGFVHAECSDPCFFLTASHQIKRERIRCGNDAVKRLILMKFGKWYCAKNRAERHREYWGIEPDMDAEEARVQVRQSLSDMEREGFLFHRG